MSDSIAREQVRRVLDNATIPRHWTVEPIKRRGRTCFYVEVHDLEEIVEATLACLRDDFQQAFNGIYRDTCPDCDTSLKIGAHDLCDWEDC